MRTDTKLSVGQKLLAVLARLLPGRWSGSTAWGIASLGDDDDGTGVREPRRPSPAPPSLAAEAQLAESSE